MAGPIFTNNAVGVLAASYTPDATALTLGGGQGEKFPSPGISGDWFMATIVDAANNIEIVKCTARTADTLTVVRGQEGTVARALGAGEKVEHRLTAQGLTDIRNAPLTPAQVPNGFITGPMIQTGAISTGKIALGAVGGDQLFQGRFIHESFLDVGVAEANLGYTPARQLGPNQVGFNWVVATTKLALSIDGIVKGNVLYEVHDGTVNSAGYRGLVTNVVNTDYTFGLVDNGRQVLHTAAGANTYFIPTDAAVHILIGGVIKVVNRGGPVSIVPAGGITLTWLPSGATGARTLSAPGTIVLEKMDDINWWVYGLGLS